MSSEDILNDHSEAMDVENSLGEDIDIDEPRSVDSMSASPGLVTFGNSGWVDFDEDGDIAALLAVNKRAALDEERRNIEKEVAGIKARRSERRLSTGAIPYGRSERSQDDRYRVERGPRPSQRQRFISIDISDDDESVAIAQTLPYPRTPPSEIPAAQREAEIPSEIDGVEEFVQDKKRNPRIRGKNCAITIPQCDVDPQVMGERVANAMKAAGKQFEWLVFVQESGDMNDHLHLHGYLKFTKPPNILFDHMDKYIGIPTDVAGKFRRNNYQSVRSPDAYKKYLMKEQTKEGILPPYGCYGSGGTLDVRMWAEVKSSKSNSKREEIANYIKERNGLVTMAELHSEFGPVVVARDDKLWYSIIRTMKDTKVFKEWVPFLLEGDDPIENRLYSYLNTVMPRLVEGKGLPVKKNAIVLISPPNFHKTGLLKHLGQFVDVKPIDINNTFPVQLMPTDNPGVITLDSFDGKSLYANVLEKLLDAETTFNVKNGSYRFSRRPLEIICTNMPLDKWYLEGQQMNANMGLDPKRVISDEAWDAIKARLNVFVLNRPLQGFEDPEAEDFDIDDALINRQ